MHIDMNEDGLTLLVHLGYLAYDSTKKSVHIPNEEIREEFVRAVTTGKHTEIAKLIRNSDHLLDATVNMDAEEVAAAIKDYGADILLVGINYDPKSKEHSCMIERVERD